MLDPVIAEFLATTPSVPEHLDLAGERRFLRLSIDLNFLRYGAPGPAVHSVEDCLADGVRIRIYRPSGEPELPAFVSLHGGGWYSGSIDEDVAEAIHRQRCVEGHCIVVAVEYRLAPEHPFPAGLDDVSTVLEWLAGNAARLGVDAERIAVGGSSAGANLAAAAALRARDHGPALAFQLLEVPALDLTGGHYDPALPGPPDIAAVVARYTDDPGHPLASPLLADDLSGLPPTHVMTAEFDPMCAEGEAYAKRLAEAGVPATVERYAGAIHGSALMARAWEPAARWQRAAGTALKDAFWPGEGISS